MHNVCVSLDTQPVRGWKLESIKTDKKITVRSGVGWPHFGGRLYCSTIYSELYFKAVGQVKC
jgi:hypothetical protein